MKSVLSEPEELKFYPFLNSKKRACIDDFINKFEPQIKTFVIKRYSECKTIQQIAFEMGYSERNIFKIRKRLLLCWYYQNKISIS